jgi:hypothetical protein
MRAFCDIKEIFDEKFSETKQELLDHFISKISHGHYADDLCGLNQMNQKETAEALSIVQQLPRIFHLQPKSFSCDSYERG